MIPPTIGLPIIMLVLGFQVMIVVYMHDKQIRIISTAILVIQIALASGYVMMITEEPIVIDNLVWTKDGTMMYTKEMTYNDTSILQYSCSVPFDISTCTKIQSLHIADSGLLILQED